MRAAQPYLAFALCAGCLSVPAGKQPQCTTDSDCDTSVGEVCEQGACWGGPPTGQFAAIVVPPNSRPDLISVEIPQQTLATDGDLGNVALGNAVTLSGRVEAFCQQPVMCTNMTIAATVTVSRPSRFAGGPGFTAVATAKRPSAITGDRARTGPRRPEGRGLGRGRIGRPGNSGSSVRP